MKNGNHFPMDVLTMTIASIYNRPVKKIEPVRHIGPSDRIGTDPSAGVVREEAFTASGVWSGVAFTEPGIVSGWHHHGNYETSIYVESGKVRVDFGLNGEEFVEAETGDFVHVPAGVIHRESNPGRVKNSLVLTRAGTGPTTFNVDSPDRIDASA
jgi:uncharacterized RmlC-like cupin family protein